MKTTSIVSLLIILLCGFSACTNYTIEDPDPGKDPEPGEARYVGSEACMTCHDEVYNKTKETAMYNALTVVENGPPSIPGGSTDLLPPDGYTWGDLSFVIGGYEWSATFVTDSGYVVTQRLGSQFNLADQSRIHYKPAIVDGTQVFECGACHTTGWGEVLDEYSPHHINSFPEKYSEEGIRCEACHGPGSVHISNSSASSIVLDKSSELCGRCHQRNDDNSITSEGKFIAIGQQYEEWYSSEHRKMRIACVDCHDPHASTVHEETPGDGVKACSICHAEKNADSHYAMDIACTVCHMPKSLKIAMEENEYTGDASSHIFKISTDASYHMFSSDGLVNKEGMGLSLDYVCYQCHRDENGAGGSFSVKSMEALSQKANNFHR
jgi:predicted CXXCH cytochrome family protein